MLIIGLKVKCMLFAYKKEIFSLILNIAAIYSSYSVFSYYAFRSNEIKANWMASVLGPWIILSYGTFESMCIEETNLC